MTVTIIPAAECRLPSQLWVFDAPEPSVHPALGNVSVGGAECVTAVQKVESDLVAVRVAVTMQRRWKPYAAAYSERAQQDLGRECINLAAHGAVTDGLRHITGKGIS